MAYTWAKIQAFDQVFEILTVQTSTWKRLTLSIASIFVNEGLFIYLYFLLFDENRQNLISRAGEKISSTISLFFRKIIVYVLKISCAKRFKDRISL